MIVRHEDCYKVHIDRALKKWLVDMRGSEISKEKEAAILVDEGVWNSASSDYENSKLFTFGKESL